MYYQLGAFIALGGQFKPTTCLCVNAREEVSDRYLIFFRSLFYIRFERFMFTKRETF